MIWVPINRSSACVSTRRTSAATARGPVIVSLAMMAKRTSGKARVTSSASRSTPGPQAASVSSAPQAGQADGIDAELPQWWHSSRPARRCSTNQAVQFGQSKRWPQARHRVRGA